MPAIKEAHRSEENTGKIEKKQAKDLLIQFQENSAEFSTVAKLREIINAVCIIIKSNGN